MLFCTSLTASETVENELVELQQDWIQMSEVGRQKLQMDENYSDDLKQSAYEILDKTPEESEKIIQIANDPRVSDKRKIKALKKIKKLSKILRRQLIRSNDTEIGSID
jgi:hypothetical protein